MGIVAFSTLGSLLSGCASLPVFETSVDNKIITVPRSGFSLNVRMQIIRSEKLDYDILLVLNEANTPLALKMRCSHFDNILTANNKGLACNLHGSTFNLEGNVTKGPASRPLIRFKTTEENDSILIHIG